MCPQSLAPASLWTDRYTARRFSGSDTNVPFKNLFAKYLPTGGDCFEVGCFPGRFLAHLGKKYNYVVSGIDLVPGSRDYLQRVLTEQGVKVGALTEGDFLQFIPESKYDVVCSFGFVEHFTDTEDIIRRHLNMLKPGGILLLSSPNFTGVQYLLHRCLDKNSLAYHNIESMDFRRWTRVLADNEMEILFQNYYGTCGFWVGDSCPTESRWRHGRNLVAALIKYSMMSVDKIVDYPNPVLSPFMVSISRKRK